ASLRKLLKHLQQQYNPRQIQMCMNVCKLGGMTRDELLAAAHDAATAADPDAASSVVSETAYGQSPVVGTSDNYARQDHSHGTPNGYTQAQVNAAIAAAVGELGFSFGEVSSADAAKET